MALHFDPVAELAEARKYKILADSLNHPETAEICDRFSILVALCEHKAMILRELDRLIFYEDPKSSHPIDWPDPKTNDRIH